MRGQSLAEGVSFTAVAGFIRDRVRVEPMTKDPCAEQDRSGPASSLKVRRYFTVITGI